MKLTNLLPPLTKKENSPPKDPPNKKICNILLDNLEEKENTVVFKLPIEGFNEDFEELQQRMEDKFEVKKKLPKELKKEYDINYKSLPCSNTKYLVIQSTKKELEKEFKKTFSGN